MNMSQNITNIILPPLPTSGSPLYNSPIITGLDGTIVDVHNVQTSVVSTFPAGYPSSSYLDITNSTNRSHLNSGNSIFLNVDMSQSTFQAYNNPGSNTDYTISLNLGLEWSTNNLEIDFSPIILRYTWM